MNKMIEYEQSFITTITTTDMKSFKIIAEKKIVEPLLANDFSQPFFALQKWAEFEWIKIPLAILLFLTWTFGLPAKHAIIKSAFQTGLKSRPVNILILVEQIVNLVHRSMFLLGLFIILLAKTSLNNVFEQHIGVNICPFFTSFPVFGAWYAIYGSFGITWYRAQSFRKSISSKVPSTMQSWTLAVFISIITNR